MKLILLIIGSLHLATSSSAQTTFFTGCSTSPLVFCNAAQSAFEARIAATTGSISLATFSNKNAPTYPDGYFANLAITSLISTNNSIATIGDAVFTAAVSVTQLSISEPALQNTTANAFAPIASTLTSLSFQNSAITSVRMNGIATGFATLNKLHTLTLSANNFVTASQAWFSGLDSLQTLDLSSNFILDTASIFAALGTVSDTLHTLILTSNLIATVSALPSMPALQVLSLNNNLIAALASSNPFANAVALTAINLNGNTLTAAPSIASQTALLNLDLSNQKGALLKIGDSAFSRTSTPSSFLSLSLDANTALNYSEKAFCSSAANQYRTVTVPFSSVSNINVCHLAQLGGTAANPVDLIIPSVAGVDFSTYCNCNNYKAGKTFNVNLLNAASACSSFTNLTDAACASTVFVNTCSTSVFACTATTTSSSTSVRFNVIGFLVTNTIFMLAYNKF